MTAESVLQALQSMEFTRDLDPQHLKKLAAIATEVTFSEGATVFREGDASELVYLIEEGEVAVEIQVPGHGQVQVLTVGPGQLLGWSSLFPPRRKTAGGRALTPTRAIAINSEELRNLLDSDHELGYAIMWRVAEVIADRLKATRMHLVDLLTPPKKKLW